MTPEMLIYNELADEAAGLASRRSGHASIVEQDGSARNRAQQSAKRLAAIEVSMWGGDNNFKKFEGKDSEKFQGHRRQGLKGRLKLPSTTQ